MTGFHVNSERDLLASNNFLVGFSIDKTVSDAANPYIQVTCHSFASAVLILVSSGKRV